MSGEKRSQDQEDTLLKETTIIVDIEGTTSSISFVKETLFPYIRENVKQYIEKNWEVEEFKADLAKLKEQAKKDESDKVEGVVSITGATPEEERETVLKNVLWQMDGDRKTGALKQLQGHIWREAYKSGAIKGHVYEDVPKAFDLWTKSGRKIYVYSSGSVEAQKLLFGHSEHGDMLKYFNGHFDTEVGPKQEASSYKNILAKIDAVPSSVLFLTDIVKEAEAAKEAGISVNIVVRPGNAPLTDEEKVTFTTIQSFTDLSFQTSSKRQKVEKPEEKEPPKPSEPEVPACEPMDTTDDAAAPIEKISEKIVEKVVDDAKKPAEAVKIETETTATAKSEVTSMEVESKLETEKKPTEVVEKVAIVEETKKTEEESKTKENKEAPMEAESSETVNKKDGEAAKEETMETAKPEIKASKDEAKVTNETSEEAKKESETTKTEIEKVANEPVDEAKKELPSKTEPTAAKTEEKTEAPTKAAESAESETKIETETKSAESGPEEKPKEASSAPSTAAEDSSKASVETKPDEKPEEKKIDKLEPEVAPNATEKAASKSDEKPAVAPEVKQNGGSVTAKPDEASASKLELNGAANEETPKKEETVAETKSTTATKEPEEKSETVVDSAKKDDKGTEESKSEETVVAETADAKLNGNAQNGNEATTATDDKPHRNGLNGDSLNDKKNGNTKDDTSAQNGDAESTTEAASTAESIKVKKVVDSTIADGAGEPDVVSPVAVAATS